MSKVRGADNSNGDVGPMRPERRDEKRSIDGSCPTQAESERAGKERDASRVRQELRDDAFAVVCDWAHVESCEAARIAMTHLSAAEKTVMERAASDTMRAYVLSLPDEPKALLRPSMQGALPPSEAEAAPAPPLAGDSQEAAELLAMALHHSATTEMERAPSDPTRAGVLAVHDKSAGPSRQAAALLHRCDALAPQYPSCVPATLPCRPCHPPVLYQRHPCARPPPALWQLVSDAVQAQACFEGDEHALRSIMASDDRMAHHWSYVAEGSFRGVFGSRARSRATPRDARVRST